MTVAQIVGILIIGAGAYLWLKRGQVIAGLVLAILGVLVFVGALHASGSI